MKKIVCVTGASGYIGGQTMIMLKDCGYTVIGLDTVPCAEYMRSIADRFYQEDFSNSFALDLLNQFAPTAVVHCAGSSLVGPSLGRPADYYHNNFVKTKKLLDHIVENKINSRVIFSSSAACYGEPLTVPCKEEHACDPISPYGQSKLMIEWIMKSYRNAYNLDFVAFRYFNACGADKLGRHGQRTGASHIMARVLESLRDDKEFVLNGDDYPTPDGTCVRDYVHVADIANAHILAIDRSIPADIYNLGTCKGASNREIISAAESVTKKNIQLAVGPKREGDPAVLTADASKFHQVSGWSPTYDLDQQISHVWNWYNR